MARNVKAPLPARTPRLRPADWLRYALAAATAVVFLLPLWWMLTASVRPPDQAPPVSVEWWPDEVRWDNYARIFDLLPFDRYALNSLVVAGLAVPLTLAVASWAGFAMAQLPVAARRRLALAAVVLLMVPITALWLTRYLLFGWLGLVNNFGALLAPAIFGTSPLFVLLFYWAFRRVPGELFESARLDGAGAFTTWWVVALPLARPTAVAVSILTFLVYWGDFINPQLYLKSERLYTLPVGVRQLQQLDRGDWPLLMAAAVLMTVPAVLLFLAVQRYFLGDDGLAGQRAD